MNPLFPCDHGAATHSCIMHDPGRGTLCKNAHGRLRAIYVRPFLDQTIWVRP